MRQATVDNPGFVIRQSWRHPVYILSHRDADDIAMLPSGIGDAQKFDDRLVLAAADVGLHVNATKTKVLIRNHPWSPPLQVKNIDLDFDDDFNYPGSFIATTENYKVNWEETTRSIGKSNLPIAIKVRLYKCTVLSVLTNGRKHGL